MQKNAHCRFSCTKLNINNLFSTRIEIVRILGKSYYKIVSPATIWFDSVNNAYKKLFWIRPMFISRISSFKKKPWKYAHFKEEWNPINRFAEHVEIIDVGQHQNVCSISASPINWIAIKPAMTKHNPLKNLPLLAKVASSPFPTVAESPLRHIW